MGFGEKKSNETLSPGDDTMMGFFSHHFLNFNRQSDESRQYKSDKSVRRMIISWSNDANVINKVPVKGNAVAKR